MSQGLVVYSDGGFRKNCGGWGIHGYLFSTDKPKKGSGNPKYILTAKGYVAKTDVVDELPITPIHYVDGFGSLLPPSTNNIGELISTINALEHAGKYEITTVDIFTDSEYVQKGLDTWVDGWKKNNWLKKDNTPPANIDLWKKLVTLRDDLIFRGVAVNISWVKAHTDDDPSVTTILGNVMADKLATLGVLTAIGGKMINDIQTVAADGYWKQEVERHPFLSNRRMYFNTMMEYLRTGKYYTGDHGTDDAMLGTKISDGIYSVVVLNTPDSILELVRNYQSSMSGNADAIIMARMDSLYKGEIYDDIMRFKELTMLQRDKSRLDLYWLDKEPLTRELQPPMLAMRAIEALSELNDKLVLFTNESSDLVVTDITGVLYTFESKKDKKGNAESVVYKLKPEYNVGFSALKTNVKYQSEGGIKETQITITVGLDIINRNALKRLEDMKPKVSIITWLEGPEAFRYLTVIEANGDICIQGSCYSNLHMVLKK